MDVILHIGAHRTGTKTFQDYLRRQAQTLAQANVGYWGPGRTRRGLFSHLGSPQPAAAADPSENAETRVQLQLASMQERGVKTLLISDEDVMGTVGQNVASQSLYPDIGARMSDVARALGGQLSRVLICPRSQEYYWSSALAYHVGRGQAVPDRSALRTIARSSRSWRDVVVDLAAALPGIELRVLPFESVVGRPEALLERGSDIAAPRETRRACLNPAPTLSELRRVVAKHGVCGAELPIGMGRWNPFTPEETAVLREKYLDDMMWLTAGADGLATLTEDGARTRAGQTLPPVAQTQGHGNELQDRQMARPG